MPRKYPISDDVTEFKLFCLLAMAVIVGMIVFN